ncbi:MAG: tetratricopeptide repeat-containing protein [Cytophagia bacterium]|nr:tetratricopeptide repeat-containing protein [Cytophagia bacterium]NBW37434.1 tetratricopeptide repeat-containing protein [Cytophagia bacterium]
MKVLLFFVASLFIFTDPGKISKINTLKSEARKAFNAGDYQTAVSKYKMLKDSLVVNEDEINLNLAHAYYQLKDSAQAISAYQEIASSSDNTIRSKANQQLGIIHNQQGKFEEALNNFKQAIKADPNNMDARYNYEMLKKKLEEQKKKEEQQKQDQKQNDQQKNKDQEQKEDQKKEEQNKNDKQKSDQEKKEDKKDAENKDEKSKEEKKDEQQKKEEQQKETEKPSEEKKETPPSVSEKLQQMKISEEKAKMLLEAMKNQEVQYLQQNKRKATKPKEKGKPDW